MLEPLTAAHAHEMFAVLSDPAIYEFENQNDYAIKLYDRAIQLGEVSGGALQAAMDAKARLIKPN